MNLSPLATVPRGCTAPAGPHTGRGRAAARPRLGPCRAGDQVREDWANRKAETFKKKKRMPPLNPASVIKKAEAERFPFTGEFEMPTGTVSGRRVTELALQHDLLTEDRVERMRRVASERCFDVVPVVEGLHDVGNIAAVARTADALGFGRLHVIKQDHDKYKRVHRKVSSGSDKWLHEEVSDGAGESLRRLKKLGYRVAVTHLREGTVDIRDIDWSIPTAFVLGNEAMGVSAEAVEEADLCVEIPMVGFVESYNVSVAAALVMWTAREDRIRRLGKNGDLTEEEIETMMGVFALRSNYKTATFVNEAVGRAEPARGIVRNSATPGFGLAKELKMLEEQVEELVTSSPQK